MITRSDTVQYNRKYGRPLFSGQLLFLIILISAVILITGCMRGAPKSDPPIHPNPNMDYQEKLQPMESSAIFSDGSAMRTPVEGTVARGELRDNPEYYTGMHANGNFVRSIPVELTREFLERGRERYDIYCSPCHSRLGDGKGIVPTWGLTAPASMHVDSIRTKDDGYFFDVITNGRNKMPSYKYQIPVRDRWAITSYIRVLQRSTDARLADIPEDQRDRIRQE